MQLQTLQRHRLCNVRPSRCIAFRKPVAVCRTAVGTQLALHVGETTIQMPLELEHAQQLDAALNQLLKTFAEKQEAKRPRRWDMMEVRVQPNGTAPGSVELFEVFCNPNAHATAFDAKLLLTLKCAGGVRVTTEGRLSNFKADLDAFLAETQ